MDWIKKHTDTVIILGGIIGAMIWMNGKFNQLEKDVAIMKTVLLMKGIMPAELISKQIQENKGVQ